MNTAQNTKEYLVKYGIKPSVQRMAIVAYLMQYRIHPTVDDIYNALYTSVPTLSKTTVYNTLKLFVEQGAVQPLVIDEKNIRFDIDISCHAHFQCNNCNHIYDIPVDNPDVLKIKQIGDLTISETHLYYKGYCKDCYKEKNSGLSAK